MSNAKKGNVSKAPTKKGVVVNRRYNRTVNHNVAQSSPKWEDMGNGILRRKGPGNKTAYIGMKGGKFVSLTRKAVDVALAPKATEVAEVLEAAAE